MSLCSYLPTASLILDRCIESPALGTEFTDSGQACLLQCPSGLVHYVEDALIPTHNNCSGQDVIPRSSSTIRLIRFLDSLPYSPQQGSPATAQTSKYPWNCEDLLVGGGVALFLTLGGTFFRNTWYYWVQGWYVDVMESNLFCFVLFFSLRNFFLLILHTNQSPSHPFPPVSSLATYPHPLLQKGKA